MCLGLISLLVLHLLLLHINGEEAQTGNRDSTMATRSKRSGRVWRARARGA